MKLRTLAAWNEASCSAFACLEHVEPLLLVVEVQVVFVSISCNCNCKDCPNQLKRGRVFVACWGNRETCGRQLGLSGSSSGVRSK